MSYALELSPRAAKDFELLDKVMRDRVNKLRQIEQGPLDPRISKRLVNLKGARSARVGDWRIIYSVAAPRITVAAVQPRGQVYKRL